MAALGVALLGSGLADSEPVGLALILVTGGFWAIAIVSGRRVARAWPGASGLAAAMLLATALTLPVGSRTPARRLFEPRVLALGALVGVLSSAIPYGLEQYAQRRVPARTFSILLSLHPAVGAAVGALLLGQGLEPREAAAIACVITASVGATRSAAVRPEDTF